MRAVIQRVSEARLLIDHQSYSQIGQGLLVLLGIEEADGHNDIEWLTKKIVNMRIFADEDDKMNRSVLDINGELMVVSQFTLHASTKKGNRPSYIRSASPDIAIPLYETFVEKIGQLMRKPIKTGKFGAHMDIHLSNDGPVTIVLDTKNKE